MTEFDRVRTFPANTLRTHDRINRAAITEPAPLLVNKRPNSDELKCSTFNPIVGASAGIAAIKNENSKLRIKIAWSPGTERIHRTTAPKDDLGWSDLSSERFVGCFHRRSARITSRKHVAFVVKIRSTPISGIKRPAIAGPTIPEMLNCRPFNAATEARSVSGTSCATIAVETGALKANPVPTRNTQNKIKQGLKTFRQLKITKLKALAANHRLIAHN